MWGLPERGTPNHVLQDLAVRPRDLAVRPKGLALLPRTLALRPKGLALRPRDLAVRPKGLALRPRDLALRPKGLFSLPFSIASPSLGGVDCSEGVHVGGRGVLLAQHTDGGSILSRGGIHLGRGATTLLHPTTLARYTDRHKPQGADYVSLGGSHGVTLHIPSAPPATTYSGTNTVSHTPTIRLFCFYSGWRVAAALVHPCVRCRRPRPPARGGQ